MDLNYDVELRKLTGSVLSADTGDEGGKLGVQYNGRFTEFNSESYDTLKALAQQISTDRGTGEVGFQMRDGSFQTTPPSGRDHELSDAGKSWITYEGQVKTDAVVSELIFQLDFNEFLRVKGNFRPVYQHSSPFQKKDWPRPE